MPMTALTTTDWSNRCVGLARRAFDRVRRISPVNGDALLYAISALFALLTIYTSTNGLYQVWGRMALAPFVFGAVASAGLALFLRRARRQQPGHRLTAVQHRRTWAVRIAVAVCVFAGALAVPLGMEVLWRFDGTAGSHVQPEGPTVEVGGQDLIKGQDPYKKIVYLHHPVKYHAARRTGHPGLPAVPAAHGGAGYPERHLAQQRPQRRPHLLLRDDARGRRGRALSAVRTGAASSARSRP